MNRIKRPALTLASAALLAVSLTACGGGAPTDASVDEFCEVVNDSSALEGLEPDDYDGFVEALQEQADAIEEVGTPEDIPDDARDGFELTIDAVGDLDADDVQSSFEDGEDIEEAIFDEDDQEKVEAYNSYESETCSDTSSTEEE